MDSEEVRKIITEALEGSRKLTEQMFQTVAAEAKAERAETKGQFEVISLKLGQIQEQTTRTNGRVTRLETEPHSLETCPHAGLIGELRDNMNANRTERKYTWKMLAFIASVVGAATGIIALVI